jgi:hypothetical protein
MAYVPFKPLNKQSLANQKQVLMTAFNRIFHELRDYKKAYDITEYAVNAGYVSPRTAFPGISISTWIRERKTPFWVEKSALHIILVAGWEPETAEEWNAFVTAWYREYGPFEEYHEAMQNLPDHLNKEACEAWFQGLQYLKNKGEASKSVSWVVSPSGDRITSRFLSTNRLKDNFLTQSKYATWEAAMADGYRFVIQYVKPDVLLTPDYLSPMEYTRIEAVNQSA